jgi:hypothetical protein
MDNVTFWIDEQGIEQVKIDRGNNEFTWLSKADYLATLAANSSTPAE